MDDRNLKLEAWLIETTGEEMMANHLGSNWNKFNDEFGFYPNMAMTVADLVWQHQQAKVDELKTLLSLQRTRNKALEGELTSSRNYGDDLQNRIDKALKIHDEFDDEDDVRLMMFAVEQALKAGDK